MLVQLGRPPTEGFILQESNTSIGPLMEKFKLTLVLVRLQMQISRETLDLLLEQIWMESTANIDTELPQSESWISSSNQQYYQ